MWENQFSRKEAHGRGGKKTNCQKTFGNQTRKKWGLELEFHFPWKKRVIKHILISFSFEKKWKTVRLCKTAKPTQSNWAGSTRQNFVLNDIISPTHLWYRLWHPLSIRFNILPQISKSFSCSQLGNFRFSELGGNLAKPNLTHPITWVGPSLHKYRHYELT